MLDKIKKFLIDVFDVILPKRSNFEIVKSLSEEIIHSLPKAEIKENWIYPLFTYQDKKVRAIIWELKYKENTLWIGIIGKMIFDHIIAIISDVLLFDSNGKFLLIPIPISEETRIDRGYNQSEIIAKSVMENDTRRELIYAPQWLVKIKNTEKQSLSQNKDVRERNLFGSFWANEGISGKYVILIDDVVTTGSTLKEARKTLMEAGAKDVFAIVIAH